MTTAHSAPEGTHLQGMSRRAYARSRGVSESAIRKHLKTGLLRPALLPGDTLDAAQADELLAAGLTRGRLTTDTPPPNLEAARRRKLRSQIALLADDVGSRYGSLADPAACAEAWSTVQAHVETCLQGIIDAAPAVAGRSADVVIRVLTERVEVALSQIADTRVVDTSPPMPNPAAVPDTTDLDVVALSAIRTNLEAARLELVRQEQQGVLVPFADQAQAWERRSIACRKHMERTPARLAARMVDADKAHARRLLADAVSEALEELATDTAPPEDDGSLEDTEE